MNTLDVVVGGQYGSESKGRVTADLALHRHQQGNTVVGVRVAGPNAGHVVIDAIGNRFALRQVPVAMVTVPNAFGVIAAGSEIEIQVLDDEITELESKGHSIRDRLMIDRQATIIEQNHKDAEGGNDGPIQNRIGSTGKGIGAARADRIWRTAKIAVDYNDQLEHLGLITNTQDYLNGALRIPNYSVVIEGTQGYGLGLHAGHYPYTTSSDCRAIDFLAMAGVSPWTHPHVQFTPWVVLRAYPIRVAGNSGPMEGETSWEELGLPEERTTVTKKVRRVGQWDADLARRAVQANGGASVKIALAMADQRFPEIAGCMDWSEIPITGGVRAKVSAWLDHIEQTTRARVATLGTGPDSTIWLPGTRSPQIVDVALPFEESTR